MDESSYRILNGLAKNREYMIEKMDDNKRSLLSKIGKTSQTLDPKYPIIWHTPTFSDKRFLKLPDEIVIDEEPGEKSIFFRFKRRNLY